MKKVEKENKTTKEVVKSTKFANTIYSIRRDRNLTQKDLADLIGVSDRTISKWENGTTVPDLCQIRNICKKLEISPSLLIKSEKKFKDNMSFIKMKLGKALNYLIHNIFLIGFIIAFILLLIYFINNFNSVKIYDLKYESDKVSFENGYFLKTKVTNILVINDIRINKIKYEPTEINLELYTYVNGDKKILYKADNLNSIFIEENKSNTDLLSKDTLENIKRNLQLTITTKDEYDNIYTYECQLTFKEKFNNNKLSYKTYVKDSNYETSILSTDNLSLFNNSYAPSNIPTDDVTSDITIKTFSEHDTPENELEKLSYIYDENQDAYIKYNKDKSIINYLPNTKKILYCKKNNDNFTKVTYFYKANRIKIMINDYKIVEASYDFSNNSLECIDGDLENSKKVNKYYRVTKTTNGTTTTEISEEEATNATKNIATRGASYTTTYKNIQISATPTGTKNRYSIELTNLWLKSPYIKSYDVIAIRTDDATVLEGTQNGVQSYIYTNGSVGYVYYSNNGTNMVKASNGFGISMNLVDAANTFECDIEATVTATTEWATVYGSYQHAATNVTLAQSKSYTISHNGYGKVINFATAVQNDYDGMQGVSIALDYTA